MAASPALVSHSRGCLPKQLCAAGTPKPAQQPQQSEGPAAIPRGEMCLGQGSPALGKDTQQKNCIICLCRAGAVLSDPGPSPVSWAEGPCGAPACAWHLALDLLCPRFITH